MSFTFEFEYALRKSLFKRSLFSRGKNILLILGNNIITPNESFRYDIETFTENTRFMYKNQEATKLES